MSQPPLEPGTVLGPRRPDADALARDDAAARPLGATVEQTGIALVRRGERVVPGPDSQARLRTTEPAAEPVATIEIPITITVGPSAEQITEAAADLALLRLREALAARTVG